MPDTNSFAPDASTALLEAFGIGRLFWRIQEAVIVADAVSGAILLWNPAAVQMFGYSVTEAQALTVDALVPDHLRERHRHGLHHYAATGEGVLVDQGKTVELPARPKSGATIQIELSLSSIERADDDHRYVLAIVRDVTERRRHENAERHAAEQRFAQTFAHASFSVQVFAPDGRLLQANAAWERSRGLPVAAVAEQYSILTDAQHRANGTLPLIERAFAGEPTALPAYRYTIIQTTRWLRGFIYPITDERGAVREVALIEDDITEQVEAETRLRDSETRLRLSLQAAALGIWDWDIVGGAITWSDGVEALHGMAPGSFDGRFETWLRRVHPDDRARITRAIEDALARHESYETEFRVIHDDGSEHWLFTQGHAFYDDFGSPLRMLGATLDVSERKRAEAERERLVGALAETALARDRALGEAELERRRLRDLFMQAPALIAILRGPAHTFELANPLFERTTGRRALEGRPARQAFPELAGRPVLDLLDQVYATGEPYLGAEMLVPLDRGDGVIEDRFFDFVFQPTRAPAGAVDGILIHAVEVTEQLQARQAIEEALATRAALLASVSHDLKTPLTAIRGLAEVLIRRGQRQGGETAAGWLLDGLGRIEASADRMQVLLDELVDAARLEAGLTLELHRAPTDLVALARTAIAEQQASSSHAITLVTATTTVVGPWDASRLGRVLANLLSNAVKFSPAGGPITVTVAEEDGAALLSVRDQGVGIPAEDLPRIFERFHRGANVQGRIAGSGIGLAGAKQIIEQHGGAISVTSGEGQGSVFTVHLPLTEP